MQRQRLSDGQAETTQGVRDDVSLGRWLNTFMYDNSFIGTTTPHSHRWMVKVKDALLAGEDLPECRETKWHLVELTSWTTLLKNNKTHFLAMCERYGHSFKFLMDVKRAAHALYYNDPAGTVKIMDGVDCSRCIVETGMLEVLKYAPSDLNEGDMRDLLYYISHKPSYSLCELFYEIHGSNVAKEGTCVKDTELFEFFRKEETLYHTAIFDKLVSQHGRIYIPTFDLDAYITRFLDSHTRWNLEKIARYAQTMVRVKLAIQNLCPCDVYNILVELVDTEHDVDFESAKEISSRLHAQFDRKAVLAIDKWLFEKRTYLNDTTISFISSPQKELDWQRTNIKLSETQCWQHASSLKCRHQRVASPSEVLRWPEVMVRKWLDESAERFYSKTLRPKIEQEIEDKRAAEASKQVQIPEGDQCVVCLSEKRVCAVVPCGHVTVCNSCCKKRQDELTVCPLCRKDRDSFLRVYF